MYFYTTWATRRKKKSKEEKKVLFRGLIWPKAFLSCFEMLNLRLMYRVQLRIWPSFWQQRDMVEKATHESLQFLNASGQTLLSAITDVMYWNVWFYSLAPEKDRIEAFKCCCIGAKCIVHTLSCVCNHMNVFCVFLHNAQKVLLFSNTFYLIWK